MEVKSGETELDKQLQLLKAAYTTIIYEEKSSNNVTVIRGETARLVCKIYNLGHKSVSWNYVSILEIKWYISNNVPKGKKFRGYTVKNII